MEKQMDGWYNIYENQSIALYFVRKCFVEILRGVDIIEVQKRF